MIYRASFSRWRTPSCLVAWVPRRCWEGQPGLKNGQGLHLELLAAPRPSVSVDGWPRAPFWALLGHRKKEKAWHGLAEGVSVLFNPCRCRSVKETHGMPGTEWALDRMSSRPGSSLKVFTVKRANRSGEDLIAVIMHNHSPASKL